MFPRKTNPSTELMSLVLLTMRFVKPFLITLLIHVTFEQMAD
jgi:hypothetical protein